MPKLSKMSAEDNEFIENMPLEVNGRVEGHDGGDLENHSTVRDLEEKRDAESSCGSNDLLGGVDISRIEWTIVKCRRSDLVTPVDGQSPVPSLQEILSSRKNTVWEVQD